MYNLPQPVRVNNFADPTADFFRMLQELYRELDAKRNEDQAVLMLCYSPAGTSLQIQNVRFREGYAAVIFDVYDENGDSWYMVAQPQTVQVLMRIVTLSDPTKRRPIGFQVEDITE